MELSKEPNIQAFNVDCMEFMKDIPDNYYDLAIIDPPYGIGNASIHAGRLGKGSGKLKNRVIQTLSTKFDDVPMHPEYFETLKRVAKNRIIWGGNYFELPPSRCIVCWDKVQPWENFSQIEIAWTSFDSPARIYKQDNRTGGKIHPTQKPVQLYRWLLKNYAKEGYKILDTHGGSFSSAIACHMEGYDLDICELDEDYFNDAVKRFNLNTVQGRLF